MPIKMTTSTASSKLLRTTIIAHDRSWRYLLQIFIVTLSLQLIAFSEAQFPADRLLPPPAPLPQQAGSPPLPPSRAPFLPFPQALTHSRPIDYSQRFQTHSIPLQRDATQPHGSAADQTGLATRIARWFGFGNSPQEQELIASSFKNPAYDAYQRQQQQQLEQNGKGNCNLCNKYPWIPMMPMSVQYPPMQQPYKPYLQTHWNQEQAQASRLAPNFVPNAQTQQQTLLRQRAVQFNFPQAYHHPGNSKQIAPNRDELHLAIPPSLRPILNGNALPPIFNSQPFRTAPTTTTTTTTSFAPTPYTEQELPTTNIAHFSENIGAHSELRADQVLSSTQIPPTVVPYPTSPDVEIIKSHQLTDFVSTIEYPATFIQSETLDVFVPQTQMPINHKPETTVPTNIAATSYQHEIVNRLPNNHLPASQLITDPDSFRAAVRNEKTTTTAAAATATTTTTTYAPQQETYTNHHYHQGQQQTTIGIINNIDLSPSADNFPSASSHNNHIPWNLQSNEIYTTTTTPKATPTETLTTEIPTESPFRTSSFVISDRPFQVSSFSPPFVPSQQINDNDHSSKKNSKERGTPKRLLDSPKQHQSNNFNGEPRPFTRDPSELDYRLGFFTKENTPSSSTSSQNTQGIWTPLVTPAPAFSVSSVQPTPTSTYGAIDASGKFAGISPPLPPIPVAPKNVHQIIVPYTSKNRPRPFEPTREVIDTTTADLLRIFQNVELHEQQESKLILSRATTTTTPAPKFITKVFATNLRELLRREQTLRNRSSSINGFDLKKLQQNIDDWTEQEFTSLSHRPSTPTIRGRSKHIPAEYLTTTTTPLPLNNIGFKTTQSFDATSLSASINSLQNSISISAERGSKRFEYPPIEQNLITGFENSVTQATTTTTSTTTHPTTTTTRSSAKKTPERNAIPLYVRPVTTELPPEVLWQKAKILISPDTKEKLYVVTPQPRFFPQRFIGTSTPAPFEVNSAFSQKSPRFIVRPTPGNGTSTSSPHKSSSYSPEPFGLFGLSAFVPAEPVEIIHGNSKVVTTVTPTARTEPETEGDRENASTPTKFRRTAYITINRSTTKPTMSPSPR